jgi:hypothetical protein
VTPDDVEIADIKATLRDRGWLVRYTEWPLGHQVVVHRRADTAVARVTDWHACEVDAWREGLALALSIAPVDDEAGAGREAGGAVPPMLDG